MRIHERVALIFATGFGAGYSPVAPGTAGSLLAVLFFLGLSKISIYIYLLALTVTFFIGLWSSAFGGIYFKNVDASKIVIDEIIGVLITYIPLLYFPQNVINMVLGFLLFRCFDILKPFPIDRANKIQRPLFVILDDVIAGVYAAIILILLNILLKSRI